MGEKLEEKMDDIMEKLLAKVQKGTVAKDKKVIDERYAATLF